MANKPILVKYSKTFYSKRALVKAAYSFIHDYYVHLSEIPDFYIVEFTPKFDLKQDVARNFENELIVQSIRLQVFEETKNIRELLIGRAMASSIVMEKDPVQLITDQENENQEFKTNTILQDWFKNNAKNQ